ncbi:hypothetical protein OIU91_43155 (plasmid) [Streptomyces sp. NBC_01456]|uniref:hypothetical protein n=1 Tax=Streptomyces sp. NBC_01456 TaxID=2975868 RepID=UPI002E34CB69|nr:hypothetical protein [Streptomyces sp. NBC_01456]
MSTYETPRNERGERLCQFCHEHTVRPSLGTKPVIYCSQSCKQRAYEARKTAKAIREAVAAAERRAAAQAAKSQTLDAERRPDGPAKSQTLPGEVSDVAEREPQTDDPTSVTLPGGPPPPAPVVPAPMRSEAAQEGFTAAAKASSRRSSAASSTLASGEEDGDVLFELPPLPTREAIEGELARRVAWMEGLASGGEDSPTDSA